MDDTTRNRLIGTAIFLTGLAGLGVIHQFPGITGTVVSFLAGAALGMGSAVVITGRPLWDSDSWWASKHPLKRNWF